MLPEGVHRVISRGKPYYYWHPHRGTRAAEKPLRIPHDPDTQAFWAFISRAKSVAPPENTVAGMIAAYRKSHKYRKLRDVSRRDYDRYLDELERRLGDYHPRDITAPVVLAIQESMSDKPATANHMIAIVRTLFAWGVPNGWATTNPAREVDPIDTDSDGAEPWPMEMIKLGLGKCRWEARMFIALGYYTGQRTADILAMKLADIAGDAIRVRQSKTGKALTLPIHRDLRPFIEEAKERGSMVLVPGPENRQLTTNQWRAMWTREMAKEPQSAIRLAGLSPHGLRKSAVVALLEAGCTAKEVSSITGQSLTIVEHYAAGLDQARMARGAMAKFENATGTVLQMPAKAG